MKFSKIQNVISLVLLFAFVLSFQLFAQDKIQIQQIQQAIETKGAKWTAGENWVTKLSREERKKLLGANIERPDSATAKFITLPQVDNLPSTFDWRDNGGNWVTPVTNQLACGSCVIFSETAQVETWWKIKNTNLDSMPDLSEQFILSCAGVVSCAYGGQMGSVLEYYRTTGSPTETCFPYVANDEVPCGNACPNWQDEVTQIPDWGYLTDNIGYVDILKNAVAIHPVSVAFTVYEDFQSYSGGIYEHTWGEVDGGHAVLIVGWNDEDQCWIVKNSWGPYWGEQGYFRIKWRDNDFGRNATFIWDEIISEPSISLEKTRVDFSLTRGDSTSESVQVSNTGQQALQYIVSSFETEYMFHSDSYNAYDGVSWWCGDPSINGYNNAWLQYLDTKPIDLTGTSNPSLTCMVNWSMEDPAGVDPPYDGWDGCNVWISTDSGKTFSVIDPVSPAYTCQSLWSFGEPDQGFNMGVGIAGWAGLSNGWQEAQFDLSAFKTDGVIIRFALASDQAYCSIDNNNLKGYFVDNIQVADGATMIFENSGEDNGDLFLDGLGSFTEADWFTIGNGSGVLAPGESLDLSINVVTRELDPGKYYGKVLFASNDSSAYNKSISFSVDLVSPDHDVAIQNVWLPGESIPILFPVQPGAEIKNEGLNTESNFDVLCSVKKAGQLIYSDTARVESLAVDETKVVTFESIMLSEAGELEFTITLENLVDDYNNFNNSYQSMTSVSNLVDNFETATGFWNFQGGWGITNTLQGHNSEYAAHVSGGALPYPHNMDAYMTFEPGFDLTQIDAASLKFWTKYITEANTDICYIEASGNQVNWTKLDSLSGNNFVQWSEVEVGLTSYIDAGYEKVWVRFHFVSNESIAMAGLVIDDVEIYPSNPTDVKKEIVNNPMPTEYQLSQNYPNPFNMNTNFRYSLPEPGQVQVTIYNINGKVVRDLVNQNQTAGYHEISWNGRDDAGRVVGTGVYFYKINVKGKYVESKKMILMK